MLDCYLMLCKSILDLNVESMMQVSSHTNPVVHNAGKEINSEALIIQVLSCICFWPGQIIHVNDTYVYAYT